MGSLNIRPSSILFLLFLFFHHALASPLNERAGSCKKTKVGILGAGVAGITAAQTLSNHSITDFLIVEFLGDIGGRVSHTTFGKQPDGAPYTVELGANWVQGLGSEDGPENPIWTLAKKYNLNNTYSDYESIETYDHTGYSDYTSLLDDFDDIYADYEQSAGYTITENLLDRSVRAAYSLTGWKPGRTDHKAQAVEWWEFDWEYSFTPDLSSHLFAVVNYNATFYQYSDENNFVFDPRGFNIFIKGEASTFLSPNDPRLLLNTVVTSIDYSSNSSVTITNKDGSCIEADYAICTFSLGILQKDDVVDFRPAFPPWKQESIATFQMATYTKIFLQFPPDQVFWNTSTQFFLYADPVERGWYPVFQSLDGPGFLPGSGILFVTVVQDQSYRVESQDDEITKQEVLAVLRDMFGPENVPMPIDFMYPRWSTEPWAYGSYSNWPAGTTLKQHQNLRANLDRLWFAGEAYSAEYYGFLHGAYFEGKAAANAIAANINNNDREDGAGDGDGEEEQARYEVLHGTTEPEEYNITNGWDVSSFLTYGFE